MCSCYKKKIWGLVIISVSIGLLKGEPLILEPYTTGPSDCNAFLRNANIDADEIIEQIIKYNNTTCLIEINRIYKHDEFKAKTEAIYIELLWRLFLRRDNELTRRVIELIPNDIVVTSKMFGVFSLISNINTWELLYEKGFNPWVGGDSKSFFEFMLEKNNIRKLKLCLIVAHENNIFPENVNKVLRDLRNKSLEVSKNLELIDD